MGRRKWVGLELDKSNTLSFRGWAGGVTVVVNSTKGANFPIPRFNGPKAKTSVATI